MGRQRRPGGAGRTRRGPRPGGGVHLPACFALVSPDVLDRVLGAWLRTRAMQAGGRLVSPSTARPSAARRARAGKAPHLVAALAHGIGAVLGQVAVDGKSNEIPAVRDLLKAFAGLAGAVITLDAMHTQTDTAKVSPAGARLRDDRQGQHAGAVPAAEEAAMGPIPAVSAATADHGRRARRTIKAALAPAWIEFDGAAQVAQLRRTVTKNGKKTVEVVYLITSDKDAGPATLAAWVRGHWEIENRLHQATRHYDVSRPCGRDAGMGKGLLGLEAAVELLIGHRAWLTRADFAAAALTSGRDGITGAVMISVDFEAALAARRAGGLPCSSGEEQVLALAASIAAGVPVALGDLVCGLDEDNAIRVAIAVLHAAGFGGRSVLVTRGSRGDRQRARRVTAAGAEPETVRVVRPGHPLHGLDLAVWGRLRLRGVAMVVLVLPDGSRKRIPAAWAYEGGSDDTGGTAAAVVAAAGGPAAPAAGDIRHSGHRREPRGASCTAVTRQGGRPCSLHNSVCCRTRFRRQHRSWPAEPSPPIAQAAAAIVTRLIIQAAQPGSPACPPPAQQGVSGGE